MLLTCGLLTNRTKIGCLIVRATYMLFVLSALQVQLSYISRTLHVRVLESYIGTQVESKAQVRVSYLFVGHFYLPFYLGFD